MLVRADYHTHSGRRGHAAGATREYIDRAIELGLDEIGLTDYLWPYFLEGAHPEPGYAMSEAEYLKHYEENDCSARSVPRADSVRIAVEADFIEGRESELAAILDRFEFDYVLGSVRRRIARSGLDEIASCVRL